MQCFNEATSQEAAQKRQKTTPASSSKAGQVTTKTDKAMQNKRYLLSVEGMSDCRPKYLTFEEGAPFLQWSLSLNVCEM